MSRTKRKFDDYEDFDLNLPSKMKKDQFRVCSSSSSSSSSSTNLQFFVRMISEGKTLVLHSTYHHTIKQIHEQIQFITKIPIFEQRLIYRGKQLQYEQTLAECFVQNDATLQLVGRMRSTEHPKAWQLVDEMVCLICKLCKGKSMDLRKNVKSRLVEFLKQTPKENGQKAGGHLGIFVSSCAPKALVMLYMSPVSGNKDCGGECIREFVGLSKDLLPKGLYEYCAPIVLEFCRLLGRWDPLYALCRSSLGSMVECVGVGGGLKSAVGAQEIVPFMIEIAENLAKELESCLGLPLATDVKDFSAFLVPLRTVVMGQVGFECRVSMPFYEGGEVVKIVYGIYVDLMGKIEGCLEGIEKCLIVKERGEVGEVVHSGWSQYLTLLKELNSISKLYEGAEEEFWAKLSQRRVSLCYLIIKFAVRGDDHRWILEHKDVINFESRRHLTMLILPEVKDEYEELHEMLIDRSQLLAESFEYIAHADPDALRGGLFLEFKNEEATGPGVLREWFFLVCQAIFNPQNALFVACPNDRRRFFPNPASNVDPLHLDYFCFSGRVIALALVHKVQVGIVFDRVFFLQLAGMNVSLEDIRDADPFLYSSCKQILEMDSEIVDQDALGLTFVREVEELGNRKVVELCPDGKSIAVNSSNRKEYVDLLIRDRFVTSIAEQVSKFAQGFADIISSERLKKLFFQSLELEDLDWMLHGSESDISVEDWKAHIEYNGYKETDPQIIWFWKIVGEMSVEQRKVLLFFWTSVKYLPIEGFGGLASRLYIYKSTESFDHLPSSHTCFYRLCFPSYPSMEIMRERLHLITQEHVGCSFGTW